MAKIEGFKKEVKQFDNIVRDKDTKLKECEAENTKMTSKIVNMEKVLLLAHIYNQHIETNSKYFIGNIKAKCNHKTCRVRFKLKDRTVGAA